MCGIAGYYSLNSHFTKEDLHTMVGAIKHRGPDAEGYFVDHNIGLGHRRLSIIDLSEKANQPMHSACGRYTLVYNGEIYNFKEIARELEDVNVSLKTNSDTEIVVEAYAKWGDKCVEKFNGMFSIAIYDQEYQELFLCRDRIGIKPLYYYWDGANLLFASELKAISCLKYKLDLTINTNAINEFLHLGYIPQPHSIYKFVQKFPSGATLKIRDNDLQFSSYWHPNTAITESFAEGFAVVKQTLKEKLVASVKSRMMSDVPFGTFLSGGVDSSLITAIAQAHSDTPIRTFSIGFKEDEHNESPFAKKIATHLKTNHSEFIITEQEALEEVKSLYKVYDEPFADSSAIPMLLVSKMASEKVKMTLSGDGADELFLGYGIYNWAVRLNNDLLNITRQPLSGLLAKFGSNYKRVAKLLSYPKEATRKSHIFSQEQCLFSSSEIESLVKAEYQHNVSLNEDYETLARKLRPEEEQALFDLNYYLKDDLLVKVDRATMHHSLETRVPFLDHKVVEYAVNISPQLKRHKGVSKYILKEVLYDYVPKKYVDRPKKGFSIPLAKWLKGDLRFLIDTYLSKEVIEKYGVVHYSKVEELKVDFLENNVTYLYNRLWLLIVLHQWFEENL